MFGEEMIKKLLRQELKSAERTSDLLRAKSL